LLQARDIPGEIVCLLFQLIGLDLALIDLLLKLLQVLGGLAECRLTDGWENRQRANPT
jgi:hypothetical protein